MSNLPSFERLEEARAKINLSLEVLGSRPDGYHELVTLMSTAGLADRLFLSLKIGGGPWAVTSSDETVPGDEDNLCFQAAQAFFSLLPLPVHSVQFKVHIEKKIPAAAGLGGGSADAASTLRFLWQAWREGLAERLDLPAEHISLEDLDRVALSLGADVPFCLYGGVRLCRGVGEVLSEPLTGPAWPLLIAKPDQALHTGRAFARLDSMRRQGVMTSKSPDPDRWPQVLSKADPAEAASLIHNDFLPVARDMVPEVNDILRDLLRQGAFAVSLSGSGPSCFGLFENEDRLDRAHAVLAARLPAARWIKTALSPQPELLRD